MLRFVTNQGIITVLSMTVLLTRDLNHGQQLVLGWDFLRRQANGAVIPLTPSKR